MNVVFKTYLLVWFFFSITCGTILTFTWSWIRASKLGRVWTAVLFLLILSVSTYTLIGTLARVADRWPDIKNPPRTLNGMLFMRGESKDRENGLRTAMYIEQETPLPLARDYDVFVWMNTNIQGTPTIVEGHTSEYRWGSRYSVYTGLPTVVGWSWHLRQHNTVLPDSAVENRVEDVNRFYNTENPLEVLAFLEQYQVDFIVVGDLERAIYSQEGIAKFASMVADGTLEVVYPEDGEIGPVNILTIPDKKFRKGLRGG